MTTLGEVLYNGYCEKTNWKSLASGQDLPAWKDLRPDIQEAWHASAMAMEQFIDATAERTEPDYAEVVRRLKDPNVARLLHAGIGMATEAGEYLDGLKKYIYYGKPLDRVNLREEIGDASWYQRIGASALKDTFLGTIIQNIRKLMIRFPDKFTQDKALNRNLEEERKLLEE